MHGNANPRRIPHPLPAPASRTLASDVRSNHGGQGARTSTASMCSRSTRRMPKASMNVDWKVDTTHPVRIYISDRRAAYIDRITTILQKQQQKRRGEKARAPCPRPAGQRCRRGRWKAVPMTSARKWHDCWRGEREEPLPCGGRGGGRTLPGLLPALQLAFHRVPLPPPGLLPRPLPLLCTEMARPAWVRRKEFGQASQHKRT
jgi:hypothetical protein